MSSREAYERLTPGHPFDDDETEEIPADAIAVVLHHSLERGVAHCYLFPGDKSLTLREDGPTATEIVPLANGGEGQ
jgi:hypothetical protein